MFLQNTLINIPLLITVFFTAIGTFYIWIYRKGLQDILGIVIIGLSIIWISAFILEQSFEGYHLKVLFDRIQYTSSTLIPLGAFLLVCQYTDFKKILRVRNIVLLSIVPVMTLFLIFTNEFHRLVWINANLVVFESFSEVAKEYNTWYFIFIIYTNILTLTGIVIIIQNLVKSFLKPDGKNRWKKFLLVPYISFPWLVILAKTLGFNPFPTVEEMPVIMAISTFVLIGILNRTRIREILPVAFNTIFDNMRDGLVLVDRKSNILKINPSSQKIFDTSSDSISGKPLENLIKKVPGRNNFKTLFETNEIKIDSNGSQYYYNTVQSEIKGDSGKSFGKVIALRDVTEMKKAEENIKYLSFHDKLTGSYNRAFFDAELDRLDSKRQLPLSLVIGDVNGLKIINDAFGHAYGDQLLKKIVDILKECFREEDIIARWGGDEFSIILPGTTYFETLKILERVHKKCKDRSTSTMPLSISFGVAVKEDQGKQKKLLIKEAEDKMYRHKLMENQSNRSAIISSLGKALEERDYETEEHTRRMKKYAALFGEALNMPDSKLDELRLLASLHDIGKISISDNIILKPNKLNETERSIVEKHAEVGYRIAQSSVELASIAKLILHHHERWDGRGYPYGLKETEIPIISRIISIIDTFDAMTSDRPYRKALSKEEAIEEFNRCKGSQFDPDLVDTFLKKVLIKELQYH